MGGDVAQRGWAASSGGGNRRCAHGWVDAGVGVGEGGPEEAPGAGVKRLRKLAGVIARRSSGFVVAQVTLRGGARRAALGLDAEGMVVRCDAEGGVGRLK